MSDETRERHARMERDQDLLQVLQTAAGRRFVWRLIANTTGTLGPSYTGEALSGAYKEGLRAVGIFLTVEAQRVSPAGYLLMLQEEMESRLVVPEPPQEEPQ